MTARLCIALLALVIPGCRLFGRYPAGCESTDPGKVHQRVVCPLEKK